MGLTFFLLVFTSFGSGLEERRQKLRPMSIRMLSCWELLCNYSGKILRVLPLFSVSVLRCHGFAIRRWSALARISVDLLLFSSALLLRVYTVQRRFCLPCARAATIPFALFSNYNEQILLFENLNELDQNPTLVQKTPVPRFRYFSVYVISRCHRFSRHLHLLSNALN